MAFSSREALEAASDWYHRLPHRSREVRHKTIGVVRTEEQLVRRSIALVQAALLAALAGVETDLKMKAVHACATVQLQLIFSGWQELLDGFYAAAASKCRLIAELSDYIAAASRNDEGARKLLDNEVWRPGHARRILEQDMITDPDFAIRWRHAQIGPHDELDQFALVRGGLLSAVMHVGEDAIYLAHNFSQTTLASIASEYAQLAVVATRADAIALGDELADDSAWNTAHAELLRDWEPYSASSDERVRRPS
jgi:hypothetical protein